MSNIDSRYLVATTTVWSGASYIYSKDAVKILNQGDAKDKDGLSKKQK
jgi:cardiolipin synthase (CMP-forming)